MARPPFPKSLRQFQVEFATEEACQKYLAACRWPDGFLCPQCGHRQAYILEQKLRWQCAACRHQVSLTSGTVLHNTKTPLTVWFWAAYLLISEVCRRCYCSVSSACRARNRLDDVAGLAARKQVCEAAGN